MRWKWVISPILVTEANNNDAFKLNGHSKLY